MLSPTAQFTTPSSVMTVSLGPTVLVRRVYVGTCHEGTTRRRSAHQHLHQPQEKKERTTPVARRAFRGRAYCRGKPRVGPRHQAPASLRYPAQPPSTACLVLAVQHDFAVTDSNDLRAKTTRSSMRQRFCEWPGNCAQPKQLRAVHLA